MKKVLSIGRMEPSKRPFDFISIARDVINQSKLEVSFYWIGEGSLLEQCQKITDSDASIQFLGYLSDKQKISYLRGCDIYISTSESEGFNLTVGEALLLKKPVIAYDLQVYHDIYNNYVIYVPLKSCNRFVKEILKTINEYPIDLYEQASIFIKEQYSAKAIRKKLLKIFLDLY